MLPAITISQLPPRSWTTGEQYEGSEALDTAENAARLLVEYDEERSRVLVADLDQRFSGEDGRVGDALEVLEGAQGLSPPLLSVDGVGDEAEVGKEREDGAPIGDRGWRRRVVVLVVTRLARTLELALPEDLAVLGAYAEGDEGLLLEAGQEHPAVATIGEECPDGSATFHRTFRSVPNSTGRFDGFEDAGPAGPAESRPLFGPGRVDMHDEQQHGRRAHPHRGQPPGASRELRPRGPG